MANKKVFSDNSEINLRIESYDDIFSDFDIRPYSHRALSIDFIDEMKRASNEMQDGSIEVMIHLPKKGRSEYQEKMIQGRLANHFKRHHHLLAKEKKRVLRFGIIMIILGIFAMIAATFIIFEDPRHNWIYSFLVVFLEPAAWFLLWEGMDQVLFNSKNINPDLAFYRKMDDVGEHIHFNSY